MNKFIKNFFADFFRILAVLQPREKLKTIVLFSAMALQTALELFFILTLAYMGTALTDPESLRSKLLFRGIFYCFPLTETITQDARYLVLLSGVVVVVLSVSKNIVNYATARATALFSEQISISLGKEIMSRFLYRDYIWHLSSESGSTFQRMLWRGHLASMLVAQLSMYASILTLLVLFLSLVGQEPMLTTIVVAITGTVGFLLYRSIRHNVDMQAQKAAESAQEETRALMCATKGIRDVLIYRQQDVFLNTITGAAQKGVLPRTFNTIAPTMPTWVLEATGFAVVVMAIAYLVCFEKAEVPRIAEALGLLMLTAWRVLPYANRVVSYQVGIRALRPMTSSVLDLLENLRNTPSDPPPIPARDFTFRHEITLDQVSFRYPEATEDSLHKLTFSIPVGKKLGIIGPSGAGKSTLVGVLSGLLHPREGSLFVDGRVLDAPCAAAFAQIIGYVPQSPFLFAGTLAENVAFCQWGKPWDEARVQEACSKAAIDFMDTHPQGMLQPIGENGAGLSGGQAQRVSIARAMYTRPKLLIFDEATSALDQANENSIQQTIMELSGGVTCVIIAHRLTTVEKCDSLIWMDKGKIVMQGMPEKILQLYRESQGRQAQAM
ncbi:MAG: ABC transporter ATP-binding protein [Desulfovibrionaceae bacterium]|nr:ABC transporter ATP-binding protein [Desulfovibrionaceae bacterium]